MKLLARRMLASEKSANRRNGLSYTRNTVSKNEREVRKGRERNKVRDERVGSVKGERVRRKLNSF